MGGPYIESDQKRRLFGLYQHLHGKIHSLSAPLKLHYCVSNQETLLAWVSKLTWLKIELDCTCLDYRNVLWKFPGLLLLVL